MNNRIAGERTPQTSGSLFQRTGDFLFRYRWLIGVIFVVLGTLLKLHGSSIGVISQYLTGTDTSRIFGTARPIRSDEYVVFTEMALSQVQSGFPWFSDIWGYSARDMFVVYGQPVLHPVTVFRPFSIVYILAGAEYGLSFYWVARTVFLFLVSFEFGRVLTGDKRLLSAAYACLITFSPLVQWWYSVNELVEMLFFGQLALLLLNRYFRMESVCRRALLMAGLVWCAGGYVLVLYPAWMIPFFYAFVACFVAMAYVNHSEWKVRLTDAAVWGAGILILMLAGYVIWSRSGDTIQAIMNTAYPGRRVFQGGVPDRTAALFFGWSSWLWTFVNIVNPCEIVSFVNFFPIGLLFSAYVIFKQKTRDPWLLAMNAASILLFAYLVMPMSSWVASITLLGHASYRMGNAIDFLQLMVLIRSLTLVRFERKPMPAVFLVSILILIGTFSGITAELSAKRIVVIVMFIALTAGIFCCLSSSTGRKVLPLYMILISLAGGLTVNPLESGLSGIYNAPVLQEIRKINEEEPGLWFTSGNLVFSNLPTIVGAKTANALQTYPDRDFWTDLGFAEQEDIWNRYAHITARIATETAIELPSPDHIHLSVTPEDLQKIGVGYVFSEGPSDATGLELLAESNDFYIYKILQ